MHLCFCSFNVAVAGIFEFWSSQPTGRERNVPTYFLHTPLNHGNGTFSASVELNVTGVCKAHMMVNHTFVASNHTVDVTVYGIEPDTDNTRLDVWNTRYGGRALEPLPVYVRPAPTPACLHRSNAVMSIAAAASAMVMKTDAHPVCECQREI